MLTTALFASILVALVGALILWSNPARAVNRSVCLSSMCIAAWLGCLHIATTSQTDGLFWLRWTCAAGATIPVGFATVYQSILGRPSKLSFSWMVRTWGVLAIFAAVLFLLPFTDAFIPGHSTPQQRIRGWGYYAYMWALLGVYCFMFYGAFRSSHRFAGARRLELQIWLGGGCAMLISVLITMALNALTHQRIYIRIQPILVLVCYAGLAVAITTNRIFNARQLLLLGLEKTLLVSTVAGVAYLLDRAFALFFPEAVAFFATVAVALWLAVWLGDRLDRAFRFYPQATAARQAAFAVARRESRVETLEKAFREVLRGWGQTDSAFILSGSADFLQGDGIHLTINSPEIAAMRQLKWATPERLAREKVSPERVALADFLKRHEIGVMVISEGSALVALVGAGVPASRRPFTYPQVAQLTELASIVESALERAHFSIKAQHAEQLATVGLLGASLAHEIRNPLVSIKTFVQLLPSHHQEPAFREKFFRLIGDEVERIDQLTEQLLDLASPRTYAAQMVELHPILRASLELVSAKAVHKQVQFHANFQASPDHVFTDASAAKQVILNLCFNAIQAVEREDRDRWVRISTQNVDRGVEITVADSGPGIAPEIRTRLFEPFQTTRSSGFGLGLAICSDILGNLNASISVDAPKPGCGAIFRVIFPCQPS